MAIYYITSCNPIKSYRFSCRLSSSLSNKPNQSVVSRNHVFINKPSLDPHTVRLSVRIHVFYSNQKNVFSFFCSFARSSIVFYILRKVFYIFWVVFYILSKKLLLGHIAAQVLTLHRWAGHALWRQVFLPAPCPLLVGSLPSRQSIKELAPKFLNSKDLVGTSISS